jgi:membrane protein implicated in regulation of membrane protease activity
MALVALGLEFMTGTLYLLVVALALTGGGLAAWFALGITGQFIVATGSGALAYAVVGRWKRRMLTPGSPQADDPDIGQEVRLLHFTDQGFARVFYRGAEWDAQMLDPKLEVGKLAYIVGRDGNLLKISSIPTENS